MGQLNNRSRIPSFQVTEKQNGKIGIVWDFPQPQTQVYSRCIKLLFQNQHFFVLLPPLLRGISQSSVQAQKWQMEIVLISPLVFFRKNLKDTSKNNFMASFYGLSWTVSRLQSHYKGTICFLPVSLQELLVLIWSTSGGSKANTFSYFSINPLVLYPSPEIFCG